jgi:hypothetical protein
MIASVAIVIFNLLNGGNKLKTGLSLAISAVFIPLYFFHYHEGLPSVFSLEKTLPFLGHMLGAHFSYEQGIPAGLLLIIIFIAAVPVSFKPGFALTKEAAGILGILAFVMASILVTSAFRSNTADAQLLHAYSSRYQIYPHLLTGAIFVMLVAKLQHVKWKWPVFGIAILVMLGAYKKNYDYGKAGFERNYNRLITNTYYYPDKARAEQIAKKACAMGIYCIEENRE